ncbi:hypothetical protein [Lysobacter hankyongensis]|uniref:hypothetical protein n=1 Tax=Lysobacter hankyongensis TaxID=1176535 RepID=UPI0031EC9F3A
MSAKHGFVRIVRRFAHRNRRRIRNDDVRLAVRGAALAGGLTMRLPDRIRTAGRTGLARLRMRAAGIATAHASRAFRILRECRQADRTMATAAPQLRRRVPAVARYMADERRRVRRIGREWPRHSPM